ncbi:hypothetical protein D3C80_1885590 [compost metagenome]
MVWSGVSTGRLPLIWPHACGSDRDFADGFYFCLDTRPRSDLLFACPFFDVPVSLQSTPKYFPCGVDPATTARPHP